jgi:hypothetical protein
VNTTVGGVTVSGITVSGVTVPDAAFEGNLAFDARPAPIDFFILE